ncbi:MAG: hypothetical protein QXU72_01750 [Thermofilum sp.]|uniref:DUF47 family protein n=1 Tax=Thermofilum pendens TaxID=2269 RepID=A0A7C4H4F6_THEPE
MMSEADVLEKLERIVPGFRGYRDKDFWKEDDALIRKRVAEILDEAKLRVERLITVMKKKSVGAALRLDDLRLELIKASQMLKHAERNEATILEGEHVESKVLEELVQRDYELVSVALRIMERVVSLGMMTDSREFMERLNETIEVVYTLEDSIRKREALVRR